MEITYQLHSITGSIGTIDAAPPAGEGWISHPPALWAGGILILWCRAKKKTAKKKPAKK